LATPSAEEAYQKYAWIFLLVPAFILGALSVQGVLNGYPSEAPNNLLAGAVTSSTPSATVNLLNYIARGAAGGTLDLMVLVVAVAVTGYRRGARWAWFIELYVFAASVAAISIEVTEGQNNLLGVMILGVPFLLGLFLPFRKFFPTTLK
jgi:branched-subunit amino acid transport protein